MLHAAILIVFFLFVPANAGGAEGLPEGCHRATNAEKAAGASNVVCPRDREAGITGDAGSAKQYLSGVRCGGNVDIEQLDNKFAICANKFMKELRAADGGACITSAYRGIVQQQNACRGICGNPNGCPGKCARPGHSYHQKGLAIDMRYRISNQDMWRIAARSGLHNPVALHSSDPIHVQASGASNCAGIPVHLNDGGDYYADRDRFFPAPPSDYQAPTGQHDAGSSQPPPQSQPNNDPEQQCTLPDGMRVPCSSIANQGSPPGGGEQGGQPPGGVPPQKLPTSQQPFQQSLENTPREEPVSSKIKTNADDPDLSKTQNTTTNSTKKSKITDPIDTVSNPRKRRTQTSEADTNAPLVLTVDGSDAHTLAQEEEQQPAHSITTDDASYKLTPRTQQTFASNDLNQTQPQDANIVQKHASIFSKLQTIKATLLRILEYLRSFGDRPFPR